MAADRDVEKSFSVSEFIAELRRLADALESGEAFTIEIDGEEIIVPENIVISVEHERDGGYEELEFQLSWESDHEDDEDDEDDTSLDEIEVNQIEESSVGAN